jgi:hypothetical protein
MADLYPKTRRGLKPERPKSPEPKELPEVIWCLDARGNAFGVDGPCHEHSFDNAVAWHFLIQEQDRNGEWNWCDAGDGKRVNSLHWLSFAARTQAEAVHMLQVQLAISGVRAVRIFEVKPPPKTREVTNEKNSGGAGATSEK